MKRGFYTPAQIALARTKTPRQLWRDYKQSERALQAAAKTGKTGAVARVMDTQHHDIEYAMLYQTTERARKAQRKKV